MKSLALAAILATSAGVASATDMWCQTTGQFSHGTWLHLSITSNGLTLDYGDGVSGISFTADEVKQSFTNINARKIEEFEYDKNLGGYNQVKNQITQFTITRQEPFYGEFTESSSGRYNVKNGAIQKRHVEFKCSPSLKPKFGISLQ